MVLPGATPPLACLKTSDSGQQERASSLRAISRVCVCRDKGDFRAAYCGKMGSMSSIKRGVKKKLLLRPEVESVSRDPAHGASMGKFSESILVVSSVAV